MRSTAAPGAFPAAITLLAGICALSPGAAAEERAEATIRGTVRDSSGVALGGCPVRFLKTKTILNLFRLTTDQQQVEEAATVTDAEGQYEIRLAPDPEFDYFYLRFYDPKSFDPVRYQVPADIEITHPFKEGGEVVVDPVIRLHADWPRVEEMANRYGADSNRTRILRSLGLPERREAFEGDPGRENWWYYAKGLCYQLREDDVLRVRRYDPVIPPRGRR